MSDTVSAQSFSARASGLKVPAGLTIDSVELSVGQVDVDTEPFALRHGQPGRFEARLGEGSIHAFLSERLPSAIRQIEVEVNDSGLVVRAIAKVLFEIRAVAVCGLRIEDSKRLHVELASVEPGGPVRGLIEGQLREANPVFDADHLPVPVRLESVAYQAGEIVIFGTVDCNLAGA